MGDEQALDPAKSGTRADQLAPGADYLVDRCQGATQQEHPSEHDAAGRIAIDGGY